MKIKTGKYDEQCLYSFGITFTNYKSAVLEFGKFYIEIIFKDYD